MEYPELSLGNSSFFSESEECPSRKRKYEQNSNSNSKNTSESSSVLVTRSTSTELQVKQDYFSGFHDHQIGRMYNLSNNRMMKKNNNNYDCPKHQKLDLELNISNFDDDDYDERKRSSKMLEESSSNSNMVAMGCLKCNLLVMLSKSFPSCPNCKFVNYIPAHNHHQNPPPPPPNMAKSLCTLSLLH